MNSYDIDLSQITQISYDGQDLNSLVLDNQTVWNRPPSDANDSIIQRSFTAISQTSSSAYSGIYELRDSDAKYRGLELGSHQEMSQDGTVKAFNYHVMPNSGDDREYNVVVLSRTDVDTSVWSVRDIVNFGSTSERSSPSEFAMNHDGSILATSVNQGNIVKIFRWNGSSYTLDQSLSVARCYSLKFSHTQNTLAVLMNGAVRVFADFNQELEQIGLDIPLLSNRPELHEIEVADGTHTDTYLYGSRVFICLRGLYSSNIYRYEHTPNNTWEQDIGQGISDPTPVSHFKVDTRGEKVAVLRRRTFKSNVNLRFKERSSSGEWSSTASISDLQYSGPYVHIGNSTYNTTTSGRMAASNDLGRVYLALTDRYSTNNYPTGAAYGHYICCVTQKDVFVKTQKAVITTEPKSLFQEDSLSINVPPYGYVHGGVSCNASGELMSFHYRAGGNNSSISRIVDYGPTPSYTLSKSRSSMFEGNSVVFTLDTTDVEDSDIPYTITGIQSSDILEPLTGIFNLVDSTASVTINTREDFTTEGKQTITLTLDNGQSSAAVDIIDTSV